MFTLRAGVEVIESLEVNGPKASSWVPSVRCIESIRTASRRDTCFCLLGTEVVPDSNVICKQGIVLVERRMDPAESALAIVEASIIN